MKTKTGKSFLLGIFLFSLMLACKEDHSSDETQSEAVEKYLEFRTKMNAMNASFGQMSNFLSIIGASQLHNNMFQLKSTNGDTIYADSIPYDSSGYWDYWTCATVTEFDNGDGTHTTIYDYGDGCDEFGSMTRGKITYIWKNDGDDYYSKVLYENYYSYGMEMNGFSEYTFTSDGDSYFDYDSSGVSEDSSYSRCIVFYWSGTSSGKDNMIVEYDNGEKYTYTSNYSNRWDNSTYTLLEGEYTYTSEPAGYNYHYLITSPLVYNYECINTWVAVSGVETIHYTDPVETYDFMIDYGNGTCDNLAEITENGKTSVIDFGDLITLYGGAEPGDSASVNLKR